MSLVDSSSDDDCYVNSAKALKAIKKKTVITMSPLDQESPRSLENFESTYMPTECMIIEASPAPKTRRPARRGRRNTRRNVNHYDSDDTENMPELFAKKKPVESISLIDSDPEDITGKTNADDTLGDDADENYEITIKVKWQSAKLERLPLRRYQEFSKVFEYFSTLENVPQENIWLVLRNKITIKPSDTPDSLGLTIVDIIEGGIIDGNQTEYQTVNTNVDKDSINIKVQTKDHKKTLTISIKKTQKIKVLLIKCAEQLKVSEDKIKFQFDGEPVHLNETPDSLDLEGGECFDMYMIP